MAPSFKNETQRLLTLAKSEFGDLQEHQVKFFTCAATGKIAYMGPSEHDNDPSNDSTKFMTWGSEREIAADMITWICLNREARTLIPPRGLQLWGTRISGPVDLAYAEIPFRILLANCGFTHEVVMRAITVPELSLAGSSLKKIDLRRSVVKKDLKLSLGCRVDQGVSLQSIHVGGDLDCSGGILHGPVQDDGGLGSALNAWSAVVEGDVLLTDQFQATGVVQLVNIQIGGDFNANGGRFKCSLAEAGKGSSVALDLTSAQVRVDILFGYGFASIGKVSFASVVGGGDLTSDGKASIVARPASDGDQSGYALDAVNLQLKGDLSLSQGLSVRGLMKLAGAHVNGDIELYAKLSNAAGNGLEESGTALAASNVIVNGDVHMADGFAASGMVEMENAQIDGSLDCSGGKFRNPAPSPDHVNGEALSLLHTVIKRTAFLNDGFESYGSVLLGNARIGGDLNMRRASLHSGILLDKSTPEYALSAENLTVAGDLLLRNGFAASGPVTLLDSAITGTLDCSDATFSNPYDLYRPESGLAIQASRVAVKGAVLLRGLKAEGQINLAAANIGSNLDLSGARLCRALSDLNPSTGVCLKCSGTQVGGDVFMSYEFVSHGQVVLDNAQFGGGVFAEDARFLNPAVNGDTRTGIALNAFSVKIARSLSLRNGFRAEGRVYIANAHIEQVFDAGKGTFLYPMPETSDIKNSSALAIRSSTIRGAIYLYDGVRIDGYVDLTDTDTHTLVDDETCWPPKHRLVLNGFTYRAFNTKSDAEDRLRWLDLQPESPFYEQPFLQLAKVLADQGDDEGSKKVLISLEDRKTKSPTTLWIEGEARRLLLGKTIGYGYRPLDAIIELSVLTALGWIVYRRCYLAGNLVPKEKTALEALQKTGKAPPEYPHFAPFVYSLENSLPLVRLGQGDSWGPASEAMGIGIVQPAFVHPDRRLFRAFHRALVFCGMRLKPDSQPRLTSPRFVRVFLWFQILLGWLLATLFAAGIAGLVHSK